MKLNLGSGTGPAANEFYLRGYTNIDRSFGGEKNEVYPLMYDEADDVTEIRASHVLEHLSFRDTMDALKDWVRVLKPGGVLKIAVPDFEWIARKYLANVDEDAPPENVTGYLMGGQSDANDYHKAIFDRRGLKAGMEAAGLVDVKPWESETDDCASLPVSLNLQGTKSLYGKSPFSEAHPHIQALNESTAVRAQAADDNRWFTQNGEPPPFAPDGTLLPGEQSAELSVGTISFNPDEIACVLSVPRLGFMSNMQCLLTVSNLGIQVRMQQGAFWGQCLTDAILQFMEEEKYRYILTVDYDSIFTMDDVLNLYRYMASPGADWIHALTTVQVRRENDNILLTMGDTDGEPRGEVAWDEMQKDVVKVRTAHFGLTLFRVDALRRLPHPWFLDIPDADGKWGPGKLDCDISFWQKWAAAGNSLYLAPRVAIGHLEQVISWPDARLKGMYQKMSAYQKVGKPDGCWR